MRPNGASIIQELKTKGPSVFKEKVNKSATGAHFRRKLSHEWGGEAAASATKARNARQEQRSCRDSRPAGSIRGGSGHRSSTKESAGGRCRQGWSPQGDYRHTGHGVCEPSKGEACEERANVARLDGEQTTTGDKTK